MPESTIVEITGSFTVDQIVRIEEILAANDDHGESGPKIAQIVVEAFGEIGEEEASRLQQAMPRKEVCGACNCKTGKKSCTTYVWSGRDDVWQPIGVALRSCDPGECSFISRIIRWIRRLLR